MDFDLYTTGGITFMQLDGEMNAENCMEVRETVIQAVEVNKRFVPLTQTFQYLTTLATEIGVGPNFFGMGIQIFGDLGNPVVARFLVGSRLKGGIQHGVGYIGFN